MLLTGQLVGGRYQLTSRIAAGGMGEVWRARDERLQRDVAVKLLHAAHADDQAFRARLKAEARSAGALNCDSVVGVYDWGEQVEDDGRWLSYIVMELVDGQTLASVIAQERALDPVRTAGVVADTATGLAAAHRVGLVHRDVKPANLLMTPDGRIKVADFGIARATDSLALTATGTLIGTAMYLSPEQVRGRAATAASDIYSLGVVAYQCLTSEPPFRGDGEIATALARLSEPVPPLPSTVPPALNDLIMAMLSLEPNDRPTATQVAMAAGRVAMGSGATTPEEVAEAETLVLPIAATAAVPTTIQPVPIVGTRTWPTRRLGLVAGLAVLLLAGILVPLLTLRGSSGDGNATPPPTTAATSPAAKATTPAQLPVAATQPLTKTAKPKTGHGPGPGHKQPGHGHGHGPGGPPGHNKP